MLRILQTLFFAERGFALLLDVTFCNYVLLVFYEAHKRTKGRIKKILPILSFSLRLCLSKFANVSSQF